MGLFGWLFGDRTDRVPNRLEWRMGDEISELVAEAIDAYDPSPDDVTVVSHDVRYFGVVYEVTLTPADTSGLFSARSWNVSVRPAQKRDGPAVAETGVVIPESSHDLMEAQARIRDTVKKAHKSWALSDITQDKSF